MKVGYAKAKSDDDARALPSELTAAGVEKWFVDLKGEARPERDALFAGGARNGDTLVLLSRSHLGRGQEISRLEAMLAEMGVSVEVFEIEAPAPRKPGPKPQWNPSYKEEEAARRWWQGPFKRGHVFQLMRDHYGHDLTDQQLANMLNKYLGPRKGDPKPWINQQPKTTK